MSATETLALIHAINSLRLALAAEGERGGRDFGEMRERSNGEIDRAFALMERASAEEKAARDEAMR